MAQSSTKEQREEIINTLVVKYDAQIGALARSSRSFIGNPTEHYAAELRLYLAQNPHLLECSPVSIALGVLRVVQTGLSLGVSCDLLAFKKTVQFSPRYTGLVELAYASGVRGINVDVVRKGEPFRLIKGTRPDLKHTPLGDESAEIVGAYVCAELKQGSFVFDYQSREQLDAIRRAYSQRWWTNKAGQVIPLEEIAWWARKRMVRMGSAMWPKNPRFAAALMYEQQAEEADDGDDYIPPVITPNALPAGDDGEDIRRFEQELVRRESQQAEEVPRGR